MHGKAKSVGADSHNSFITSNIRVELRRNWGPPLYKYIVVEIAIGPPPHSINRGITVDILAVTEVTTDDAGDAIYCILSSYPRSSLERSPGVCPEDERTA